MHIKILLVAALSGLFIVGCASEPTAPAPTTQPSAAIEADSAAIVVFGMSCPQCSNNLNLQLTAIDGVDDVDVDLGTGDVIVTLQPGKVTAAQLRQGVIVAGYTVDSIRIPA